MNAAQATASAISDGDGEHDVAGQAAERHRQHRRARQPDGGERYEES